MLREYHRATMSDLDFGTMVDDNQTINSDHDSVDTAATCRSDDFEVMTYMDRNENGTKIGDPRLSLEARRQSEIKSQSMINALNQFILQAGNIYKGNKLSFVDKTRLRSAASEVGVSTNVVEALIEQTGDRNAIMDYCMNSDDAFARKMKEDPKLSRILRNDRKSLSKDDELNVTASVWRIFMHKIIKQFLKEQNMQLTDIIEKSAQTRKLYEETLSVGREKNKFGLPMIPRDYTEERKRICITDAEAKEARREASEEMEKFQLDRNPSVYDLVNEASMQIHHELPAQTEERDRIFITDAEAKEARREASEEMEKFQLCRNPGVYNLVNEASMQIHRQLPAQISRNELMIPDSRDDDLSMMPCATEQESPFMPRIKPGFDPMTDLDVIPFLTKQDVTIMKTDSYCETAADSECFVDSRNSEMRMSACETKRESSVIEEDSITHLGIADDLDSIPCPPEPELSFVDMNQMVDPHNTIPSLPKPSEKNEHTPKREVLQTITKSSLSESNTASAVKQRITMYEKKPTSPEPDNDVPERKIGRSEQDPFPGGNVLQALAKFEKKEEPQNAEELLASPQPKKNTNGNVLLARALFEKKDEDAQIATELIASPQLKKSSRGNVSQARTLFEKKDEQAPLATEFLTSPQPKKELSSNVLQAQTMFEKKVDPHMAIEQLSFSQPKTCSGENVSEARALFEKKDDEIQPTTEYNTSPKPNGSRGNVLQALSKFENKDEYLPEVHNLKRTKQNIQHVLATWTQKEQENPFNVEGGTVSQESTNLQQPVNGVEIRRTSVGIDDQTIALDTVEEMKLGQRQVQVQDMQASNYNLIQRSASKCEKVKSEDVDATETDNDGFGENFENFHQNPQVALNQNVELVRTIVSAKTTQKSHSMEFQASNDHNKDSETLVRNELVPLAQKSERSPRDSRENCGIERYNSSDESNQGFDSKSQSPNNSFGLDHKMESFMSNEIENIDRQSDLMEENEEKRWNDSRREHQNTLKKPPLSQRRKHPWQSNVYKIQSEGEGQPRQTNHESDVIDTVVNEQNKIIPMNNNQEHSIEYLGSLSDDSSSLHIHSLVHQQTEQSDSKFEPTSNTSCQQSNSKRSTKEDFVEARSHTLSADDFGKGNSASKTSWTEFESSNSFREESREKTRPRVISDRSGRVEKPSNRCSDRKVADSGDIPNRLDNGEEGGANTWTTFESENLFQESLRPQHGSSTTERIHQTKFESTLPDEIDSMEHFNVFPKDGQTSANIPFEVQEPRSENSNPSVSIKKMPDHVEKVRSVPSVSSTSKDTQEALDQTGFVPFNLNPFPKQPMPEKSRTRSKRANRSDDVKGTKSNEKRVVSDVPFSTDFNEKKSLSENPSIEQSQQRTLKSRATRLGRMKTSREEKKPKELLESLPFAKSSVPTESFRKDANTVIDKLPVHDALPLASQKAKEALARARKFRDTENSSEIEIHQDDAWEFFPSDFKSSSKETSVSKSDSRKEHSNEEYRDDNETGTAVVKHFVPSSNECEQRIYSKTKESSDSEEPTTGNEFKIAYPLADEDIDIKLSKEDQCVVLDENDSILDEDEGIKNFVEQRGEPLEENAEKRRQLPERINANYVGEIDDNSAQRRHLEELGEFLISYSLDDRRNESPSGERQVHSSSRTEQRDYPETENVVHRESRRDNSVEEWSDARDTTAMEGFDENKARVYFETNAVDNTGKNIDSDQMEPRESHEVSWPADDDVNVSPRRSQEVEDHEPRSTNRRKSTNSINDDLTKDRYREKESDNSHQEYPVRILDRPLLDLDDDEEYYDAIEVERQDSNESGYPEPEATRAHSDDPQSYHMGLKPDPLPDPSPKGNGKLSPEGTVFTGTVDSAGAPEGATEEELKLLNHFIEVASSNFNGNTLSADSEARVRSAALKVGLTSTFVDQLLNQTMKEKEEKKSPRLSFIPFENPPPSYESEQSNHVQNSYHTYPSQSTSYTANDYDDNGTNDGIEHISGRTARERRRHEDPPDACNAWDGLVQAIGFFASSAAKACGMDYHNRRDDESVVSALSWEGGNDARRRRPERFRESTEPYVPNYPVDQEEQHCGRNQRVTFADCCQGGEEAQGQENHATGGSSSPPRPKIRQLV